MDIHRIYRHINGRDPLVYGLPSTMFIAVILPMGIFSLVSFKVHIVMGVICSVISTGVYLFLTGQKKKHGNAFLSKVISYYTIKFWVVKRRNVSLYNDNNI